MSACEFSRCYPCREYSHQCLCESSLPAQSASTLDTSPPSRTSNAASANGAASLLAFERILKFIAPFAIARDEWSVFSELELIDSALQQRIEVSGVERRNAESPIDRVVRSGAHERHTNDDKSTTAGVAPGLTSSLTREQALQLLDRYAAASIDRWCTGELKPQVDAAAEACLEAFGIGTAKARSLDAPESLVGRESQNTCGKIAQKPVGTAKHGGSEPPIRIAVDPWQGLGKTWSEK